MDNNDTNDYGLEYKNRTSGQLREEIRNKAANNSEEMELNSEEIPKEWAKYPPTPRQAERIETPPRLMLSPKRQIQR